MPPNRTMPHADDIKTNGKFDKGKFNAQLPNAMAALASGETKIHKIVIDTDEAGKPSVEIFRSHNHSPGGLHPDIAIALQKVLVDSINAGTVRIGDMSEGPAPVQDVFSITSA